MYLLFYFEMQISPAIDIATPIIKSHATLGSKSTINTPIPIPNKQTPMSLFNI